MELIWRLLKGTDGWEREEWSVRGYTICHWMEYGHYLLWSFSYVRKEFWFTIIILLFFQLLSNLELLYNYFTNCIFDKIILTIIIFIKLSLKLLSVQSKGLRKRRNSFCSSILMKFKWLQFNPCTIINNDNNNGSFR